MAALGRYLPRAFFMEYKIEKVGGWCLVFYNQRAYLFHLARPSRKKEARWPLLMVSGVCVFSTSV